MIAVYCGFPEIQNKIIDDQSDQPHMSGGAAPDGPLPLTINSVFRQGRYVKIALTQLLTNYLKTING